MLGSIHSQPGASSAVGGQPARRGELAGSAVSRPTAGTKDTREGRASNPILSSETSRRGFLKGTVGGSAALLASGGLGGLLAACSTGSSTGSGSGGNSSNLLMAASLREFSVGADFDWNTGAKLFAQQMGMADRYQVMLCGGDTQQQISQVQEFLTKAGPGNAILGIDPNDTSACEPLIQLCQQHKAYCWTFATRPAGVLPNKSTPYWMYGAFDPSVQVDLVMKVMLGLFNRPTKFLLLNGDRSHSKAIAMNKILRNMAATNPKLEIIGEQYVPNWDRDNAYTIMKTLLVSQPQVQALWCGNDSIALGALQALKEAGRKIPVSGIDADPEAVKDIMSGEMTATISQQMPQTGFYSLAITYAAHKGVFDPATAPMSHRAMSMKNTLITKDNAADYYAQHIKVLPHYSTSDIWVESTGRAVTDF